jgi:flagellar basal-body rod modification protein FlgD
MELQSIRQTAAQEGTRQTLSGGQVTRDDFLKLLIAQLQNQDPLSPLDNQEFAVQLATFNSLEQLLGVNEKLEGLQSKQLLTSQLNSAALIGKQVTTNGNQLSLMDGSDPTLRYQLASPAARVVVNIQNSRGELVRQLEFGSQQVGEQSVRWDGKDASGKRLSSGVYTFEVNAFDPAGKKVSVSTRAQGLVTGVSFDGAEPVLELGPLRVPLSAVSGIR